MNPAETPKPARTPRPPNRLRLRLSPHSPAPTSPPQPSSLLHPASEARSGGPLFLPPISPPHLRWPTLGCARNETIPGCISSADPKPTARRFLLAQLSPVSVFKALPEVWTLIRPRRCLLALGFVLMVINRVTGLVLPASTKFLIDDVIGKHQPDLLLPLVGVVLLATLIQGITSFTLTQLLSKAAQRLIAELRSQVQAHIGRLPVAFFDANQAGTLVSRIMTDVEGVRNLIGTGLIDFVGGVLTAVIAFVVLMRISPVMTLIAFGIPARLRRRPAARPSRPSAPSSASAPRSTPRSPAASPSRSAACASSRATTPRSARPRSSPPASSACSHNVITLAHRQSLMSLSSTVLLGIVGALVMFIGRAPDPGRHS